MVCLREGLELGEGPLAREKPPTGVEGLAHLGRVRGVEVPQQRGGVVGAERHGQRLDVRKPVKRGGLVAATVQQHPRPKGQRVQAALEQELLA